MATITRKKAIQYLEAAIKDLEKVEEDKTMTAAEIKEGMSYIYNNLDDVLDFVRKHCRYGD